MLSYLLSGAFFKQLSADYLICLQPDNLKKAQTTDARKKLQYDLNEGGSLRRK